MGFHPPELPDVLVQEVTELTTAWPTELSCLHPAFASRGTVECSDVICPSLSCPNPIVLHGECCPACMDETKNTSSAVAALGRCYFAGDGMHHTAGTKWHPYIPPFGFSRCAVCTCKVRRR